MKLSLVIAALILAVGLVIGWRQDRRQAELRELHQNLVARAVSLGLPVDPAADPVAGPATDPPSAATRSVRRPRDDSAAAAEARAYAADLIAFATRFKAAQDSGRSDDEELHRGIFVHLEKLAGLDPGQLGIVIDELKQSTSLDEDMRRGIVSLSIGLLAERYPESALLIADEAVDILGGPDRANHVIANALSKWAERDPTAALDWLRQNADDHPGIDGDEARRGIIRGAAMQDPRLALRLVDDLGIEDTDRTARAIAETAHSSQQRSALLDALRSRTDTGTGDHRQLLESTLKALAGPMARDGFDSSSEWIEQNRLSEEEAVAFAAGITYQRTGEDTDRWLDWMTTQLPVDQVEDQIRGMVAQWTVSDYAAAGTWLNNVTGPARIPAVGAFAETVAPYEPETAANWALTLPAGDDRAGLLKNIHSHWKARDEAAAARFAEQHGLAE